MAKPVIRFKTYRQAAAVGGKIYGVPNLGDPVVASVTMQEVIDYAKLHNYSAATLEALLSQVVSGVAELVARDGKPRNLSDLLKFEPVIKGTFNNMEQTVTNQKVLVRPRMLKEIKVALDPSNYAWQNQNDTESPKLISVAPVNDVYSLVDLASFTASINGTMGFGYTYAGTRLCPNGWDSSCKFEVALIPSVLPSGFIPGDELRYDRVLLGPEGDDPVGCFVHATGDDASDNAVVISHNSSTSSGSPIPAAWHYRPADPGFDPGELLYVPASGDRLVFRFTRTTASGDTFTVEKSYTL